MGRPVSELLATMSSREIAEWMAFSQLEPFGERRADLRAGNIAAIMANAWSSGRRWKADDFVMEEPPKDKPRATAARMRRQLLDLRAAMAAGMRR